MRPLKSKVSITLDNDMLAYLRNLAEQDARSLSSYINRILREFVDKTKPGKKILYKFEDADK